MVNARPLLQAGLGLEPLHVVGSQHLLRRRLLAVVASRRTPVELYIPFLDRLADLLGDWVVCGGFHSLAEKAALDLALSHGSPVVIFPPRDARQMRPTADLLARLGEGSLALASPASLTGRRGSRAGADLRDEALLRRVERVLVPAASRGGRVFDFCRRALAGGVAVECLQHACNADLLLMGADPCLPTPPSPSRPWPTKAQSAKPPPKPISGRPSP